MTFYTKIAHMISVLNYSNIKIAQTLKERNKLLNSLQDIWGIIVEAVIVMITGFA